MAYLLNVAYALLLLLASPWLVWSALTKGKYRTGWAEKLWGQVPRREEPWPCVWLHAVSLGEVSLIGSLVAEIERRHPDWQIAISTTTLTGYVAAKARYSRHIVFYCPLDFSWAVRRAVSRLRPSMLVLAELELWPNLIAAAKATGARVAVINGRLSERSFRGYRRIRPLLAPTLAKLDVVAVQSRLYADRFVSLGVPQQRIHVTGSLKFDGAQTDRQNPMTQSLIGLAGIKTDDVVFLAGSTQDPEERLAVEAFRALKDVHPRLRLVIVPRHPERFERVAAMLEESKLPWQRRSRVAPTTVAGVCDPGSSGPHPASERPATENSAEPRILLVDSVGELGAWWGAADIAYVGGSMGSRNGQNMIEPAAYGAAVSFGPKTKNFAAVVEQLLAAEAAVVVHDGSDLVRFVEQCLNDHSFASRLGARARQVVLSQSGATARTADLLDGLLHIPTAQGRRIAA